MTALGFQTGTAYGVTFATNLTPQPNMPFLDASWIPPLDQRAAILMVAFLLDALIGDPDWLWKRVRHPVMLMGSLIGWSDKTFNATSKTSAQRRMSGILTMAILLMVSAVLLTTISIALTGSLIGLVVQGLLVAIFLAARSLHDHAHRVAVALRDQGLAAARKAVSHIVGRDPEQLDESGVARAAIESTAENFADGVVAPAFWFLIAGLPGIVIYKLINTADSMIGHKTERHRDFGWAAARIDDAANFFPARLSGYLIAAGAGLLGQSIRKSLTVMHRDAKKHASPNAGWPETSMAGALDIALAGPRQYAEYTSTDPWLNEEGRKTTDVNDIDATLRIMWGAVAVLLAITTILATPLLWR